MKKRRFLFMLLCVSMMVMAMLSIQVYAESYSGTCGDNATWELDTTTGVLTISGSGDMYNYPSYSAPWNSYRNSIKTVVINSGVTSIGDWTFVLCSNLTNVTIPDGVTYIGEYAFQGSSIIIVTIPSSVTSIGDNAFLQCFNLTKIEVSSENQHYSSDEYGVLYNKDKTILIQYPTGNPLTEYTISSTVTYINEEVLDQCFNLTKIEVSPENQHYSSDEYGVLYNKDKTVLIQYPIGNIRHEFTIPSSVISLSGWSFGGCYRLINVVIPSSVTSIGGAAFYNCINLTRAYFTGDAPTSFVSGAFNNTASQFTIYYIEGKAGWTSPTWNDYPTNTFIQVVNGTCGANVTWELDILTGVLTISGSGDMYSHYFATNTPWYSYRGYIKTIIINQGVTSIVDFAFYNCISLTNISIPESVTSLGKCVVGSCISLTSINIPASITSIDRYAFDQCRNLTTITVSPENQYYSSDDGVLYNKDKTILQQYLLGNTRTEFTIPNGVTSIGELAFSHSSNLNDVYILDNITSIGTQAFYDCRGLTTITVSPANQHYSSDANGVLYNKDKTVLMQYPMGNTQSEVTIPKSVTAIDNGAFYNCSNLTSVYFMGDAPAEFGNTPSTFTIYYIEGKAGWTTPTWAAPNGTVYNTATFIPQYRPQIYFDTSEITLEIGETFDFIGSATQEYSNIDKVYIAIVKYDDESNGIDYFYTENIAQSVYDFSVIPSFTAGSTLINIKHTNTIQDSLTLGVGKYVLKMWINNDQGETSDEIRKVINIIETNTGSFLDFFKNIFTSIQSMFNRFIAFFQSLFTGGRNDNIEYEILLYKDDELVTSIITSDKTYDFTEEIKNNGSGIYHIKIGKIGENKAIISNKQLVTIP